MKLTSRFNDYIQTYSFIPDKCLSLEYIIKYSLPKLTKLANQHRNYEISIDLHVTLSSIKYGAKQIFIRSMTSKKYKTNIKHNILNNLFFHNLEIQATEGSGWIAETIDNVFLSITTFTPLKGSAYVKLPKFIKDEQTILNIRKNYNICFLCAILAFLYPSDDKKKMLKITPISGITLTLQS